MLDNIDLDLSNVDLSRPLIDNQVKRCVTGNVTIEEKDGKRNLVIPLTLEEPATGTGGREIQVGFVHTDRILLTPTGGLTEQMIKEKVARFQVAALGLKEPKPFNAAECSGKTVLVTFKTRPDKQDTEKLYQDVARYSAVK